MPVSFKNLISLILISILTVFFISPPVNASARDESLLGINISAKSAIVIDQESGEAIFEKNPDIQLPPASTTKIMTGIIVLENSDLDNVVKISARTKEIGESSIYLSEGEELRVEDLLYAMLVQSANDAAYALAEHVSGSEELFVDLMNRKAAEIGAKSTKFKNSYGLDDEEHLTTARDLAMIARYAMQNDEFRKIVATKEKFIPWEGHSDRKLVNTNTLLGEVDYVTGIKTGYTDKAGLCMVISAEKNGRNLIMVVLGSKDEKIREEDILLIMDYCFEEIERFDLYKKDNSKFFIYPKNDEEPIAVFAEKDLSRYLNKSDTDDLIVIVNIDENISLPVYAGEKVGSVIVLNNRVEVDSADIISKEDKEKVSIPEEQVNEIKTWKYSNYVVYGLIFIMVVLAIFKLVRHFQRRY